MVQAGPNLVLSGLLTELGWSPRMLAQRINSTHGAGTVSATAPYRWRDDGSIPRAPLPTLAASVLSHALGRSVSVSDLWGPGTPATPSAVPADALMHLPWERTHTLTILNDWIRAGLLDRRHFLAISGAALSGIATGFRLDPAALTRGLDGAGASDPLLAQIEQTVPFLQRLDDASGGGRHLPYIGAQLRSVSLLLHHGGLSTSSERRVFTALAEIAQLAGWMAFDAGQHGIAQRYYFTALRAAREAGYRSLAAHVLADLAFQAATREHPADALALGEVAVSTASGTPTAVRASVATRVGYAHALAGDLTQFDRHHQGGLDLLTNSRGDNPPWMYYLTPNHLDAQAGYALIHAGTLTTDRGHSRALLRRGRDLLATGAHTTPLSDTSQQRRALFEGAWLAVAAAHLGDLPAACHLAGTAITRLDAVHSVRSTDVLHRLHTRLRRARSNEHVRDTLPPLTQALTRHTPTGGPR